RGEQPLAGARRRRRRRRHDREHAPLGRPRLLLLARRLRPPRARLPLVALADGAAALLARRPVLLAWRPVLLARRAVLLARRAVLLARRAVRSRAALAWSRSFAPRHEAPEHSRTTN